MGAFAARLRRVARKPPRVIARRLVAEGRSRADRYLAPRRGRAFDEAALLAALGAAGLDQLWDQLRQRRYPAVTTPEAARRCVTALPDEAAAIEERAERAVERVVDLLGSSPTRLGTPIDWLTDVKTGRRWEPAYAFAIEYAELDRPSDVKVPWEISRLQWLLPAGQAYLLTGDERYARAAREVLAEWIAANPYAQTVNWASAMEPALRVLSWTWLFHACGGSDAWRDRAFRGAFLRALFLHLDFVSRNLEFSDVNGNHYTADAAGLAVGGLFFGTGDALRHHETGWRILRDELPRQVYPDGVDFEASVPYHRLVTELFLLPARHRLACGLPVPSEYRDRLARMGLFAVTYTRPDGTSPLWGDADDARALPLGTQSLHDHRYLGWIVGAELGDAELVAAAGPPPSEALWALGPDRIRVPDGAAAPRSAAFPDGGFYVMRGERDHVFVDCGPVGLAGLGGHGHNDCLSLEAWLDGTLVLTDSGSFVYTASAEDRNRFRATDAHNTPRVDGAEQNRLPPRDDLWHLSFDAVPRPLAWEPGATRDRFRGSHDGYLRLDAPVRPVRTVVLEHATHRLLVHDELHGEGEHDVTIPYHFPPALSAHGAGDGRILLEASGRRFVLAWLGDGWSGTLEPSWWSPSYGVRERATRLVLRRTGTLAAVSVVVAPEASYPDDERAWAAAQLEDAA